jgi:RNA polymerase sigma-70 factor (ECF subfamily)
LVETTSDLLVRARGGDRDALEQLIERQIPLLRRWASGRLPRWARDVADTTDLVHDTVVDTIRHLDRFEPRGEGALQAYLRQAVINRIRSEIRKRTRRGAPEPLDSGVAGDATSPLDAAIAGQALERYEASLNRLKPDEREAVMARLEFGMSYGEIAETLGKPTPNAARMAVVRALARLADEMRKKS